MVSARLMLAACLASLAARGEVQAYALAQGKGGPGIETRLSYSMGTHENHVTRASGEIALDPAEPQDVHGAFVVPIDALVSDDRTRDCHMRESLGLDYRRSRFPGDHVCNDDQLPQSDIAYPEIRLEVRGATAPPLERLEPGAETKVVVDGAWTIHGVTRPAKLPLTMVVDAGVPGGIRLRGTTSLRLKDFGIVVKSANILFVSISAGDDVTVLFDLRLVRVR